MKPAPDRQCGYTGFSIAGYTPLDAGVLMKYEPGDYKDDAQFEGKYANYIEVGTTPSS
jgi:hypothetical protein